METRTEIEVRRALSREELDAMGVFAWGIWEKEASRFPWTYGEEEECYLLEGEVVVTPDGGQPVEIRAGDFVRFAASLSCTWEIKRDVKKHFRFL